MQLYYQANVKKCLKLFSYFINDIENTVTTGSLKKSYNYKGCLRMDEMVPIYLVWIKAGSEVCQQVFEKSLLTVAIGACVASLVSGVIMMYI